MSYILEALKKSAKERKRGNIPDMLTVQDIVVEKPKKRFVWPYLLAAALLLNAGVLVWWLAFSHTDKTMDDAASNTSVLQSAKEEPEKLTLGTRPAPEFSRQVRTELETVEKASADPVGDNSSETSVSGQPSSKGPKDARSGQERILPQQSAADNNERLTPESSPAKPKQAEDAARHSAEPAVDLSEVLDEHKIYRLSELPSSIRQDLPSFSISALLYSSEPDSRMVSINGEMMHEGQNLTDGVKLEEITRDGVIFRHQKIRFRVDIK